MSSENKTQGVIALLDQYKDEKSLKSFAEAQLKTITQLTKRVKELEDKNAHLQKMLEDGTPLLRGEGSIQTEGLLTTDEEAIVTIQLNRLRDVSLGRNLTLEESKQLDVYYKILNSIRNQPKTIVLKTKNLTTQELIALESSTEEEK